MDLMLMLFLIAVLVVGVLLIAIVAYTHRSGSALNKDDYQRRWLGIETRLHKGDSATYQIVILDADKLLDKALRERKFRGETMGARMKAAQTTWKNSNHVWSAHKIRNRIAHETDIQLTYEMAARSLAAFKQGLKDLGAI